MFKFINKDCLVELKKKARYMNRYINTVIIRQEMISAAKLELIHIPE